MSDDNKQFRLSRFYSFGWLAGMLHNGAKESTPACVAADAEFVNPHDDVDERARWSLGFVEAFHRKLHQPPKSQPRRYGTMKRHPVE